MSYTNRTGSVELEGGRFSHTFSQSMMSTFRMCPEQARAIYMREVESTTTDASALGTAFHAGIEYGLREVINGNPMPNGHDLADVARHELDEIGEWTYTKWSRATMYNMCDGLVYTWLNDVYPHVPEPRAVEVEFKHLFVRDEHRDIYLAGTMDFIGWDDVVWDWKTASRAYTPWEHQRWAIQPTVYTWAMHHSMVGNIPMPRMEFKFGIVMTHVPEAQVLPVTRDESNVAWLREQATQIAWMIEHKLNPWPLNDAGWWCSPKWCPKYDACKGRFLDK